MKKSVNKYLQAFTMIELMMVIVIIGILASAALPRFANLSTQAQIAANQGFAGSLRSAVNIFHVAWIAAGAPGATTITLEGTDFSSNAFGWPDSSLYMMGIVATDNGCKDVIADSAGVGGNLLKNAPKVVKRACLETDNPCYKTTASGSVCTYTLQDGLNQASPTRTVTYDLATGTVTAN
ncbi:MAG: type II secretion system protein [Gammaproteobacteria bacterium]|nr:type II secretion system protein [Gammaproteobacteria bacterium]